MSGAALPDELRLTAAGLAGRLRPILLGLAALVARAFLRSPFHAPLIVPLWTRLNRAAERFDRLMARLAAGIPARPPRPGQHRARPPAPPLPVTIPRKQAWLIRALRHEAVAYRLQLEHLLAQPDAAALVAASPRAARLLRPICHMLGLRPACLPPTRRARRLRTAPLTAPSPSLAGDRTPPAHPVPPTLARVASPPCEHLRGWPWFPHPDAKPA